jgi:hypothetical protein
MSLLTDIQEDRHQGVETVDPLDVRRWGEQVDLQVIASVFFQMSHLKHGGIVMTIQAKLPVKGLVDVSEPRELEALFARNRLMTFFLILGDLLLTEWHFVSPSGTLLVTRPKPPQEGGLMADDELDKDVEENLKVLRTIYAVVYAVGFREFLSSITFPHGIIPVLVKMILPGTALLLVAVRMFWCVRNIRGYMRFVLAEYRKEPTSDPAIEGEEIMRGGRGLFIMLVDVPTLLMHSFLFFLLCKLMPLIFSSDYDIQVVREFMAVFVTLLLVNVVWLKSFMIRERGLAKPPQTVWIRNNTIVGLILFALWAFTLPSVVSCVTISGHVMFVTTMVLCAANSFVDLALTARFYLTGCPG